MLVRSIRAALAGLDVVDVRPLIGRIVITLGPRAPSGTRSASGCRGCPGIGNFARATHVAPDLDAIADAVVGGRRGPAGRRAFASRRGAPTSGFRFRRRTSSASSAGASRTRPAGRSISRIPEFVIRVEVLTRDAFFFFDREPGAGGLAGRHERQGHVPALGRHRLAGRGLADDPARLPRALRPLSQLSDPVAHVAGQGARARRAADAPSAAIAAVSRAVRRASSSRSSSRVPPPLRVVVYRRLMVRIAERLARARPARTRWSPATSVGQVASQTVDNLAVVGERRDAADPAAAGRHSTRKRSRARRSGSAPTRRRSCRTRTAARCSRRGFRRRARRPAEARGGRSASSTSTALVDARGRRRGRGGLQIPDAKIGGSDGRGRLQETAQ